MRLLILIALLFNISTVEAKGKKDKKYPDIPKEWIKEKCPEGDPLCVEEDFLEPRKPAKDDRVNDKRRKPRRRYHPTQEEMEASDIETIEKN